MSATIDSMARLRTAALVMLILAGCAAPSPPNRPPAQPTSALASTHLPTIDIEQPGQTPGLGQVDTAWGPIWETVPDLFPSPPGGASTEADTVASAAYTVPSAVPPSAREVAAFYADAFAAAGFGGGIDGPLEDGSYDAWGSNGYGCDMLASAVARGSEETYVTVLYGAGCPFDWPEPE